MKQIATPYFSDESLYRPGIEYYAALRADLPYAWWLPSNIAGLALRSANPALAQRASTEAQALKRRSIILIVVDTLRADHLGAYGYARSTSPNLDAWFSEGRLFERALAASPWTLPSMGTLFTGYHPMRHRAGLVQEDGQAWDKLATDNELGRLRAGLEARGLLDDALIVLTSDHGEELFEHSDLGHGHAMWQELLHIPLVVWGPGVEPGRESGPVSLADIAPTVLEWAGIDGAPDLDGATLLPNLLGAAPLEERTIYAQGNFEPPHRTTIVRWPLKVTVTFDFELSWIADLDADPDEQVDLSQSAPVEANRLISELKDRMEKTTRLHAASAETVSTADMSPETIERLKALGYIP